MKQSRPLSRWNATVISIKMKTTRILRPMLLPWSHANRFGLDETAPASTDHLKHDGVQSILSLSVKNCYPTKHKNPAGFSRNRRGSLILPWLRIFFHRLLEQRLFAA